MNLLKMKKDKFGFGRKGFLFTVDNDDNVKKILLHALAIGKYSCETFSTSFKTISVSSTFFMISDASVFIFSNVEMTLIIKNKYLRIRNTNYLLIIIKYSSFRFI